MSQLTTRQGPVKQALDRPRQGQDIVGSHEPPPATPKPFSIPKNMSKLTSEEIGKLPPALAMKYLLAQNNRRDFEKILGRLGGVMAVLDALLPRLWQGVADDLSTLVKVKDSFDRFSNRLHTETIIPRFLEVTTSGGRIGEAEVPLALYGSWKWTPMTDTELVECARSRLRHIWMTAASSTEGCWTPDLSRKWFLAASRFSCSDPNYFINDDTLLDFSARGMCVAAQWTPQLRESLIEWDDERVKKFLDALSREAPLEEGIVTKDPRELFPELAKLAEEEEKKSNAPQASTDTAAGTSSTRSSEGEQIKMRKRKVDTAVKSGHDTTQSPSSSPPRRLPKVASGPKGAVPTAAASAATIPVHSGGGEGVVQVKAKRKHPKPLKTKTIKAKKVGVDDAVAGGRTEAGMGAGTVIGPPKMGDTGHKGKRKEWAAGRVSPSREHPEASPKLRKDKKRRTTTEASKVQQEEMEMAVLMGVIKEGEEDNREPRLSTLPPKKRYSRLESSASASPAHRTPPSTPPRTSALVPPPLPTAPVTPPRLSPLRSSPSALAGISFKAYSPTSPGARTPAPAPTLAAEDVLTLEDVLTPADDDTAHVEAMKRTMEYLSGPPMTLDSFFLPAAPLDLDLDAAMPFSNETPFFLGPGGFNPEDLPPVDIPRAPAPPDPYAGLSSAEEREEAILFGKWLENYAENKKRA